MREILQLKKVCGLWLLAFWGSSAWAATATFASDLSSIPAAAVAVAVALSLIGGAASTLNKIANPEHVVTNMTLEVVRDIVSSVVAGVITYSVCAWQELPLMIQPAIITIAGFGGSRVLERYLSAGMSRIDRLGGGKPEETP